MSKFCPKCGQENLDESSFCAHCGYDFKKLNSILTEESETEKKIKLPNKDNLNSFFNWKNILIAVLVIAILCLIASSFLGNADDNISSQSNQIASDYADQIDYSNNLADESSDAGDFDGENIETHEFNYANKASFNISNSLTDKTEVKNIVFGQGVSYEYSDDYVCYLGGLVAIGSSDELEYRQNEAYIDEIGNYQTSQGYDAYIFKTGDIEDYEVLVDLNNMTIVESDGFESKYAYFWATFHSLNEAKIFIDTFKINESAIK